MKSTKKRGIAANKETKKSKEGVDRNLRTIRNAAVKIFRSIYEDIRKNAQKNFTPAEILKAALEEFSNTIFLATHSDILSIAYKLLEEDGVANPEEVLAQTVESLLFDSILPSTEDYDHPIAEA